MQANEGKALEASVDGKNYARIPLRTRVVMPNDDLDSVVLEYAKEAVQPGDLLFVTEKIVAITQGRSYRLDEITPRPLARFLSRYVVRTSYGIGLGMPETMEMALRECGTLRILFAAGVSVITKAFGRRGDFYRIAGDKARAIDGPTKNTIPPYNQAVVLGPKNPREVALRLKKMLGGDLEVAVVDINDIGGNILGSTLDKAGERRLVQILGDNPLGQATQSTPMGIVREV
ncbi:F420-0--gamma-glutamyl ligase [Microbacterium sp. 1.5R]|uniref:coenzyme F420-0:L-glutamate ligase n=1 Tax=unclassified Microbacterium TaxID=2609290 RepID=UPI00069D32B9|nr:MULTISPECIES: coenzyme F420-0:L-glutamate ligase [unclassified Microbacterium]AKV85664.1 F420-0--gamma-glutamyl ligase [Microbacterium sp. CGR1]APH45085.1 F420-0--gamma-glutamyl ligase [Microbacterium sp. 1.5R]KRD52292.1 F420-0--gamma-glutamyl ligase [Microbacterium sp. Root280D1]MBC6494773.1 F420-0--gamma-glutamyl ligase [Microbacterium sp. 4-7]MDY0982911.1 coenzyme F420-0:L-glutamate ligase [Microbacterium sp. CFBP9023]